jgi:hypothetical protein
MNKYKISIVVPYMQSDPGKPAILKRLVDSLNGYDELIISSNWKEGYAKPINRGLNLAKGDFLLVLNDDLIMDKGQTLQDMCDEKYVTSPTVDYINQPFWGCAFMIPRWVYEKVGGLDERYRISYFDDDDYINELRKANVPMKCMPKVNFTNVDGGGRTMHTFPDHNEFFEENKKKFIDKWGYTPDELTTYYSLWGKLPTKNEN